MIIENVRILNKDGVFRRGSVEFSEKIESIELRETFSGENAGGNNEYYLIPGLVDVHTHGAVGGDHTGSSSEDLQKMAAFYAKNGTTSFLATTLTAEEETLAQSMRTVAGYERSVSGARCLGINLEGPFFSHEKRGAHPEHLLREPDIDMFTRLNELSGGKIKLVCVSPELKGAMEFIREVSKIACVSLAHSPTDYKTAMQGFGNGATHVTHLFNGMSPFLHREPGLVGAALDAGAYVELICDSYHLHPAVVRAVYRMFPRRVCMISDSLNCTGQPDGDYYSAGLPIRVTNGKAMLRDGSSIAGSTITLLQGVQIAVAQGIPLADAVMAATAHPAETIGMSGHVGVITPGAHADFLLLDRDLQLQSVYIGGKEIIAK